MSSVSGWLSQIAVVTGLVAAVVALALSGWYLFRRAPRVLAWTAALLVVVGLGVLFEWLLPRRYPEFDRGLPAFAHRTWSWIYGFTVACLAALVALAQGLVRPRAAVRDDEGATGAVGASWDAVRLALAQAGIEPARQDVHLVLAPDHEAVENLVRASGVQVLAAVPDAASALRAFATPDGLFLSAAGACGLGGSANGTDIDELAGLLQGLDPDLPVVRTIVILLPMDLASRREAPRQVARVRDDLRAIGGRLRRHLPVFLLLSGAEDVPGLEELIGRMPEASRHGRCGFALPRSDGYSTETVTRGLSWLSGWFETWCLNAMAGDVEKVAGNGRLYQLLSDVRRRRLRWREVAEAACATPREQRPVALRGVYLAATGSTPGRQAFAGGLLRGARSRIPAEADQGEWSDEAWRDDRWYRRLALAVGLVGGLLSLLAWTVILRPEGTRTWWLPFLALIAAWVVVLGRMLWDRFPSGHG